MNQGEWKLSLLGVIERVERINLDKSGRNPRYKIQFHVRPIEVLEARDGMELPEDDAAVRFGAIEHRYKNVTGEVPVEGHRVRISGVATGIIPAHVALEEIEILATEH